MKLTTLIALPFFFSFASAEPLPSRRVGRVRSEVARAENAAAVTYYSGTVTASALKCRSCPKTSCTAVRQYSKGTTIKASCAAEGDSVSGNHWWDKTSDGCYVSEYYVTFSTYPPQC